MKLTTTTRFFSTGIPDLERALGTPGLPSHVVQVFGPGTSEFVKRLAQVLDFQYILVQGSLSPNFDMEEFHKWTKVILDGITDWYRTSFVRPCVVADPGARLPLLVQHRCRIRIEVSSDGTGKVIKNATGETDSDPTFRWRE